jgi:mannose-6-phosphate isomerase-like protein (cupin superfamily)
VLFSVWIFIRKLEFTGPHKFAGAFAHGHQMGRQMSTVSSVSLPDIRRIVTGHRPDGTACVMSDGNLPTVLHLEAIPGTIFHEIWSTPDSPAPVDNGPDPTLGDLILPPPGRGTRIRVVDIPPDTEDFLQNGAQRMKAAFTAIGDEKASTVKALSPHPLMHRTQSIDYGVVLAGEMVLVLDEQEVVLKPGSVVVQRGTNHAWANRSGAVCRMLFVLVGGSYDPDIAASLEGR